MKKIVIWRAVVRTRMHGFDGYAITTPDGDIETFYPVKFRDPTQIGGCDTAEISTAFFRQVSMLQARGVKVTFRID